MAADVNDLVRAIKKASNDANNAGYPMKVMAGTVVSVKPLTIKVEQRFDVLENQLIVPQHLTDYSVSISIKGETKEAGEPKHRHGYGEAKQTITVYNGLKTGEKVVLLRKQGGQKYLVVGREG